MEWGGLCFDTFSQCIWGTRGWMFRCFFRRSYGFSLASQEVFGLPLCGRLLWLLGIRFFRRSFWKNKIISLFRVELFFIVGTGVRIIVIVYPTWNSHNHHISTFDGVFHHNMSWKRNHERWMTIFSQLTLEVCKIRMNANLCALPQRVVLRCGRLFLVTLSGCWLNWFPWLLTWSFPREVVAPRVCLGLIVIIDLKKWWLQGGMFQQTPKCLDGQFVFVLQHAVFTPEVICDTPQSDRSSMTAQ